MRTPALLTLILLGAPPLHAQDPSQAVRQADSAWARSYATHDTALALKLFSPGLVMTSTSGMMKDRARELADVRATPGMTVKYFRSTDVTVRPYGDAAVVTGLLEWEVEMNGQSSATRRRYTATWIRGGPLGWQMVALHVGQAPAPAPAPAR